MNISTSSYPYSKIVFQILYMDHCLFHCLLLDIKESFLLKKTIFNSMLFPGNSSCHETYCFMEKDSLLFALNPQHISVTQKATY